MSHVPFPKPHWGDCHRPASSWGWLIVQHLRNFKGNPAMRCNLAMYGSLTTNQSRGKCLNNLGHLLSPYTPWFRLTTSSFAGMPVLLTNTVIWYDLMTSLPIDGFRLLIMIKILDLAPPVWGHHVSLVPGVVLTATGSQAISASWTSRTGRNVFLWFPIPK